MAQAACAHWAAETTSRVRVRLMTEGLGFDAAPVHVDTDGIIVSREADHPWLSNELGGWGLRRVMRVLEVRAPQVYRFKDECHECWNATSWHYVCAGTRPADAPALFDRLHSIGSRVAFMGSDLVLPDAVAGDPRIDAWHREGLASVDAMFGPPLVTEP